MKPNILFLPLTFILILVIATSLLFAGEVQTEEEEAFLTESEDPGFEENIIRGPAMKGKIDLSLLVRTINKEARYNPNNELLDLKESRQTLESSLTLSDYLNNSESLRWLTKLYGYRLFESDLEEGEDSDEFRFDELFVDWSARNWFLSLGKRRLNWGPALAFNPVNVVVPPRNPLSPDQQTEGHPLFLISYSTDLITMELIATRNYDREWYGQYSRWGTRFALVLDEMDFGLYCFNGEQYEDGSEYAQLLGVSYSGNFLSDSTLYLEAASFSQNERNYYDKSGELIIKKETVYKAAIGSNTTIDGNTSILFEYYYNSAGYNEEERKNYFKKVDSILTPYPDTTQFGVFDDFQFSEMNRNYLLISFRKSDIWEKLEIVLQLLAAEDGSSIAEFEGDYNLSDYYKILTSLKAHNGDQNSEFGNSQTTAELKLGLSASF
ncbi:capsule assembly Wzi family protein [bacterium]|nr:capsule assembly Wzi family protein [bacterium]